MTADLDGSQFNIAAHTKEIGRQVSMKSMRKADKMRLEESDGIYPGKGKTVNYCVTVVVTGEEGA
ncbi:MAG: hypothetical protein AUG51_16845 [Acidobacteria bacterium 13_1_20CM_3_53_8]|nr:MAG: hypothetical protein AUG51_16845 [Acidobacteria bacterium 13_1_20CM_3_53_8]